MIRHARMAAVVVCVLQASLYAQSATRTVNATSAPIYKSPTTASPIIGNAPHGTVLTVTRELGSWVKVSWPDALDGVGYVHIAMASLGPSAPPDASRPPASTSVRPTPASTARVNGPERVQPELPAAIRPVYVTPSTHIVGLGARVGGAAFGVGASARAWGRHRFGAQLELSRYAIGSSDGSARVTSLQFDPSLLYSLPDRVGDYVWLRPYLGSGINVNHQTLSDRTVTGSSLSDSKIGVQMFGGTELAFASVPRIALSVNLGYHWPSTWLGAKVGGLGLSVAGHWYVK